VEADRPRIEARAGKVRTASCSCGRLTVTTYGEPVRVGVCHCLACQRRTGSVFAAQARFPRENVEISGRSVEYVRLGDEGNPVVFSFCAECGATVHYAVAGYDVDTIAIPVGAFADPDFPSPTASSYGEHMHRWVALPGDIEHVTEESAFADSVAGTPVESDQDRREALKERIRQAFSATPPPDPSALRGSSEGEEPYLLEEDFQDVPDWRTLSTAFLDQAPDGFGSALSFFSGEAFRYYLPAYLLADVDQVLRQADPLFHLWHGLDDAKRDRPVNELRYGEWTWFDAVSGRLAGFTCGEVDAIVAYLRHKAEQDEFSRPKIEEALRNYWLTRLGEAAE
jgi:hypothetical protein